MRRWTRSRLLLVIAPLSFLLAGCSRSSLEAKLRFGFPTGVTKQATQIRELWTWSSVTALLVGIIVWGTIFWCIVRYRKRNDDLPRQVKYNLPIEVLYTVIPFLIIGGLFFFTARTENYVDAMSKTPATTVKVVAFKWNWEFDYNQYQGRQIAYSGTSAPVSTVGSSDVIPILVVPRGQPVRVVEHSEDVIHSFFVPEFLFKRDVIPYGNLSPSRDNQFEFTATSNGAFVGRCAELCGTYHSQMNFEVRVVDPSTYQAYLQALIQRGPDDPNRQAEALQAVGQAPYAVTTQPFNTDRVGGTAGY